MTYGYAYKAGQNEAKAVGTSLPFSYKHGVEVCSALRGKKVAVAKRFLDSVVALKQAVPYRRYNKEMAHNKGVGPGRYPIKACGHIKKIIESAEANAQMKGLSAANLVLKHVCCQKAGKVMRHGRQRGERKLSHIEIVLSEAAR